MISVSTKGFVELEKKLNTPITYKLSKLVFRVGNKMETTAKQNIRQSVYSSPASAFYARSGKAKQSIVLERKDELTARVFMGVNYGRYLEEGTGIYHEPNAHKAWFGKIPVEEEYKDFDDGWRLIKGMKARPFWKPAIKTTRTFATEQLKLKNLI